MARGPGAGRRRHRRRSALNSKRTGSDVQQRRRVGRAVLHRLRRRLRRPPSGHRAGRASCVDHRTARRHPGQQRRHHRPQPSHRAHRRGLGPRAGRRPVQPVRPDPRARPADAGPRQRQGHLHRLAAQLPRRDQRGRLRGGQERHRRADPGAVQRVGRAAESTSTPSHPATSPPTTPRPCGTTQTASRAILDRIPAGRWGRPADLAGATVFLASAPPTTSTGSSCRSTADGSAGEPGRQLRHRVSLTRTAERGQLPVTHQRACI